MTHITQMLLNIVSISAHFYENLVYADKEDTELCVSYSFMWIGPGMTQILAKN